MMTPKERAAMQQALEALVKCNHFHDYEDEITALREALKPTREGKYYYKDNACTADNADSPDCICWHDEALAEQAEQEPVAWVDLEQWQSGEYDCFTSEKVAEYMTPLYAAPVRTKDLTDEELNALWENTKGGWLGLFRAVIAADREKNNANNNT